LSIVHWLFGCCLLFAVHLSRDRQRVQSDSGLLTPLARLARHRIFLLSFSFAFSLFPSSSSSLSRISSILLLLRTIKGTIRQSKIDEDHRNLYDEVASWVINSGGSIPLGISRGREIDLSFSMVVPRLAIYLGFRPMFRRSYRSPAGRGPSSPGDSPGRGSSLKATVVRAKGRWKARHLGRKPKLIPAQQVFRHLC